MAGGSAADFWDVTLRDVDAVLAASQRRQVTGQLFLAWHIAALMRVEKLPDLETMINEATGTRPPAQSPDEQLLIVRMWAAVTAPKEIA